MADILWPVIFDLPAREKWDFGGHPFGLEPLTLPVPGSPAPLAHEIEIALPGVAARIQTTAASSSLAEIYGLEPASTASAAETDRLYWFRWIAGHQVCFILWHLAGKIMRDVAADERDPDDAVTELIHYVHATSAMFQYSGSCPRSVYERAIRPAMQLQHPAFTGNWAPDFWPVRDLFRGRPTTLAGARGHERLTKALELYKTVHEEVAARLVPEGQSLLRQSEVRAWGLPLLRLMYDNFFLTLRAEVAEDAVTGQLLRRLVAVTRDVQANGLNSDAESTGIISDAGFAEAVDDALQAALRQPQAIRKVAV